MFGNGPPEVGRTERVGATEEPVRSRIAERLKESAKYDQGTDMTTAQNRGAGFRRELGLHVQADAETAANRPGLEVQARPFRVLSSLVMALTRPTLPAVSAPPPSPGQGDPPDSTSFD